MPSYNLPGAPFQQLHNVVTVIVMYMYINPRITRDHTRELLEISSSCRSLLSLISPFNATLFSIKNTLNAATWWILS